MVSIICVALIVVCRFVCVWVVRFITCNISHDHGLRRAPCVWRDQGFSKGQLGYRHNKNPNVASKGGIRSADQCSEPLTHQPVPAIMYVYPLHTRTLDPPTRWATRHTTKHMKCAHCSTPLLGHPRLALPCNPSIKAPKVWVCGNCYLTYAFAQPAHPAQAPAA